MKELDGAFLKAGTHHLNGVMHPLPHDVLLAGLLNVHEEVFHTHTFRLRDLISDYVHTSVDLHGIGVDDTCTTPLMFARVVLNDLLIGELECKLYTQLRLSDASRATNGDQRLERGHGEGSCTRNSDKGRIDMSLLCNLKFET